MGAQVGGKAGGVRSDINVTPLVDIVLVLLIIFIVITPAVNDAVKLPIARHSEKVEKRAGDHYPTLMCQKKVDPKDSSIVTAGPILVELDEGVVQEMRRLPDANKEGTILNSFLKRAENKDNKYDLAKESDKTVLVFYLKWFMDHTSDRRVFIKADADLPFKYVNDVFQFCREAGADEASVVTGEDKSTKEVK